MDEITIEEVVNFHLENNTGKDADELLKNVIENVIELARRDLARKLNAKCIYSSFSSGCKFCGQCIGEEMDSFQDILDSGSEHYEQMSESLSRQIEMHGHPI